MERINFRQQYAQYNRYFTKIIDTVNERPIIKESLQVLLSLFAISFLVVFALRPTINTITELLANINAQKDTAQKLEAKIEALAQARQIWGSGESQILLLDQALPQSPQPDIFLQQVEGLVVLHGLSLQNFNEENAQLLGEPQKQTENKTIDVNTKKADLEGTRSVRFSLTALGNYQSLLSFLKDLELMRVQIRIDTFSLSQASLADQNRLVLKIDGSVPYLLPNK